MLSKREQIMAIIAVSVVGFLVLNRFLIGPVVDKFRQLETQKSQLSLELGQAQNLFRKRRMLEREWENASIEGLRNEVEAESKVGRALNEWSQTSHLTLSSVKPERMASDKGLQEMTFVVVGTGTLESVARFLWQIETAPLPIKVKDMQLGSSESGQSMSVQLHLSALCLGTEQKPAENKPPQEVNQDEKV
jgi:Tfp pilus assembly protein PilO